MRPAVLARLQPLRLALAACTLLVGACTVRSGDSTADGGASGAAPSATPSATPSAAPSAAPAQGGVAASGVPAGAPGDVATATGDTLVDPSKVTPDNRPRADMRLEVDLKARRLHVYQGQARAASHPVGVGTERWPTQTGEWVVSQVVWNPEWIPPRDESWTEDRERKAPGAPDNPLGRAQLIYDPPRTVHGTNQPESVGKAVSHGSIRMRNDEITQLARRVMEAAGVGEDDAWHRRVRENRTEKVIVDLPRVVPIRVF